MCYAAAAEGPPSIRPEAQPIRTPTIETNTLKDLLRLQHVEDRLVRAFYRHPGALPLRVEHRLRYALNFARLTTFQPGAAAKGGRTGRPDVDVAEEPLLAFRSLVLEHLCDPLGERPAPEKCLEVGARALARLDDALKQARRKVLQLHAGDFTAAELDDEVGRKTLVSVAGGGGGAGYVYIGAYQALEAGGLIPGYIIGASIGAVIGLFRARQRTGEWDQDIALAKNMKPENVFRVVSLRTRYGLPGLFRLFLHAAVDERFRNPEGRLLRLDELEIPYEAVVAGVWRGALRGSPEDYARRHHLILSKRPGKVQMGRLIAEQLVRMVSFFNPMIVKEIVVGSDDLTRDFDAIDAAGFSAAVPGILHYDVARNDPHMEAILTELLRREEAVCLVDGGVANNVPTRTAWHQVQGGKIGTRNAYYLGFDCFHPQWAPRHVPLQPITRLIQLQVATNRPYANQIIRFSPTLSPVNLVPNPQKIDNAIEWGRSQVADKLPLLHKFFEPVRWHE